MLHSNSSVKIEIETIKEIRCESNKKRIVTFQDFIIIFFSPFLLFLLKRRQRQKSIKLFFFLNFIVLIITFLLLDVNAMQLYIHIIARKRDLKNRLSTYKQILFKSPYIEPYIHIRYVYYIGCNTHIFFIPFLKGVGMTMILSFFSSHLN